MRFGNSWKIVALCTLFGVMLGILAFVCAIVFGSVEERPWFMDNFLLLPGMIGGIMFLAVAPTAILSVQIADGKVRHVLLNRFVLSEADVTDYEDRKVGPVLRFKQGKSIRLYGMQRAELRRLDQYLAELAGKGQA